MQRDCLSSLLEIRCLFEQKVVLVFRLQLVDSYSQLNLKGLIRVWKRQIF